MLPLEIRERIEAALGVRVGRVAPLGGGMVNHAARVETSEGPIFVKWKPDAPRGHFSAEADGLHLLARANALTIPEPLVVADNPPFLALEYREPTEPADSRAFSRRFAAGLAAQHRVTAADGTYGLDADNFLGSQPQKNLPRTADWAGFYRKNRLVPQIERARQDGRLTPRCERLLDAVLERLPELLAGMPADASLIHGDLWSGNFLCAAGDEPVLIDPAVYYAPREMELAFIELFGGFPPGFIADYDAAYPIDAGYAYRRPLHQLYPLLIHLNHFGERYGPAVEGACARYVGDRF